MIRQLMAMTVKGISYISTTGIVNINSLSEIPVFLMRNPSGSGKKSFITNISFGIEGAASGILRVYKNPTFSNIGTSVTPNNLLIGGTVSLINTAKQPTITSNGTLIFPRFVSSSNASHEMDKILLLPENKIILVTFQLNTLNTNIHGDVTWIEV